ncbi:MAG TPA: hypothetical protein PKZ32_15415 [Candidatus Melainabacteria bacterium]|nr:hypothetical protein [Candidatus Melainabacteria bacterium]
MNSIEYKGLDSTMINLWIPCFLLCIAFSIVFKVTLDVWLSKEATEKTRATQWQQNLSPEN